MIIFKIIKAVFGGGCLFAIFGFILIVGGALWSAFMDAPLEDGTTMKETFVDAGHKIEKAWIETPPAGPLFKDVDVKQVLKNDVKELEEYGREEFKKITNKTDPIIDEYGPIIEEKIEAIEKVIAEENKK